MNTVLISPSKEGNLVTAYEGNAEFGYLILKQTKSAFQAGWLREVNNSCIMKGSVKALQGFVASNPTLALSGNLVVKEYVEDAVPGPALLSDGKRILRFTVWDPAGTDVDITVQHENVDEIKAFNAATATKSAELPQ
jgi:hypothetical protein